MDHKIEHLAHNSAKRSSLIKLPLFSRASLVYALFPKVRQRAQAGQTKTLPGQSPCPVVMVVLFSTTLADDAVASAVAHAMQNASNTLAGQLSFTLKTPEALDSAVAQNSNFLSRLLQAYKTWLVGDESNLFGQTT